MRRRISEYVSVERYSAGVEDAHGNTREEWGAPETVGIYAFNPGVTNDVELAGHDRDLQRPSLYVPSDVVLGARDRVTARGLLYEVDGDTKVFRNPYGELMDGNQVDLKRWEG